MDGGTNFTITSYIVAKKISERLEGFEPSRTAWKAVMLAVEHHRRILQILAAKLGIEPNPKLSESLVLNHYTIWRDMGC